MIRSGALALAVSLTWTGTVAGLLFDLHPPAWAQHWLYNARERTAAALEARDAGRQDVVVEHLDTARRLRPDDPKTLYNAATARLNAPGDERRAAKMLERAVELGPGELAPRALYNLGNARLAAGEPDAALEAYRRALRSAPDLQPAKRNLELALARLEQERTSEPQSLPPGETPGDDRPQADEPSEEPGRPEPESRDDPADREAGSADERRSEGADQGAEPEPGAVDSTGPGTGDPQVPRFEEQEDMTPAQAAALLEAIESLERQQRRLEALERAGREAKTGEKDW